MSTRSPRPPSEPSAPRLRHELARSPDAAAITTLGWVWPPLLLALVVWMTVQVRRQPPSRTRPWSLYPVFMYKAGVGASFVSATWGFTGLAAVAWRRWLEQR